ncbi:MULTISPECIES: GAF domain-containing protein [unclassified Pseudomonas]|uniref:GAF domain-containing protein n=1 Tax=unclassified Pseudomonas TaxID=196821 RepID=UPI002AC8F16D|nr:MULTISPECIES: GAF domain-containing protein [unclassified Pseudomonas]MEB0040660.1 PAS domain-containing protein [Pseudomonas sp. MH10]MEB0076147.1 PAS domain-containing protein [Pseudomonas sp. MH10out]MEB0090642.1 PAS domain-containing protein [Pseudomonas sp. CCI4.2]MEB0103815.1 PAS domain-containing protein [Pseudomonas sp. CCI3.2]MEB0131817.1 PAS domain-containing protein [Pseudomonas sp. CCI2.4]
MNNQNVWTSLPWCEQDRLTALARLDILDTPPERTFEELASLAAYLCDAPMAQINLIDVDRQWSLAQFGLAEGDQPLEYSLCAHAIQQADGMIIEDLSADPRFAKHPQVAGGARLRFYASALLVSPYGPLGALCVLDVRPRHLSERQIAALATLASQVVSQLELRRALVTQRESEVRHRQQQARQAFLLQLSDRLHDAVRAEDVVFNLGESLGSTLEIQRIGHGRFDAQGLLTIESEWLKSSARSSRGFHQIDEYGEGLFERLTQGELIAVEDVCSDPRTAAAAQRYADYNVRSILIAPLGDDLGFNALLYISSEQPRQWSPEDIALVREVVERTQAADERAKARNALLEAEQRVKLANSIAAVGVWEYTISRNQLHFDSQARMIAELSPEQLDPTVEDFLVAVHVEDRSALVQAVAQALSARSTGEISLDFRVHPRVDGLPSWLTIRGRRMQERDGTVRLIGTARDITLERNGEENLRRINAVLESQIVERACAERFQAALLILGDQLREKTGCTEIRQAAARILGMTLGIERVAFATVDLEQDSIVIKRDWVLGAVPSLVGVYSLNSFGALFDAMRRGEGVVINDTQLDARTAQGDGECQARGMRTLINIPLLEQGVITTLLMLHGVQPRIWSDEEVSFVRDVAERSWVAMERSRAERALRDSELQFRTLADNMSQLAWTAEPSGKIYWYNKRWYDYTGTSLEAMLALGWRSVHDPAHFDRVTARVKHCFATGSVWEDTFPMRGRDGNYSWFLSRALPIRDGLGHVTHWLGTHTDITAQVNAEEALRELNDSLERRVAERTREMVTINELLQVEMSERESAEEALRHAQKMDAIGQLTGGIAHDFNNMLTGVLGALDLIQRRVAAGRVAEVDRYINAAMTSANRAASLTHRLLAFARRQSLNPQAVDVNQMVMSMEELLRRTLGESIELCIDLQPRLWQANTDEHQLESALLNLVINARDAMPEGGRLTVSSTVVHVDIQREAMAPGEYVLLSVEDSGFGMSPEVIRRAFDPFFTTKPIGQGTGLGLSMVYGFVKQTGGHVQIESVVQEGTRIQLYLPCHLEQGARHIAEPESLSAPRAVRGEQVLVVEDEVAVRLLVIDVLRELGYSTLEAGDSKTALPVLQSAERIDLLISDVGLPGLNGRQLAEMARQFRPDLPVLFMTGYARNAEVRAELLDPGMDILTKPFSVDELALKVRSMIGDTRCVPDERLPE